MDLLPWSYCSWHFYVLRLGLYDLITTSLLNWHITFKWCQAHRELDLGSPHSKGVCCGDMLVMAKMHVMKNCIWQNLTLLARCTVYWYTEHLFDLIIQEIGLHWLRDVPSSVSTIFIGGFHLQYEKANFAIKVLFEQKISISSWRKLNQYWQKFFCGYCILVYLALSRRYR